MTKASRHPRPGRRVGHVGQAYMEARAAQSEQTKKALRRIAEAK